MNLPPSRNLIAEALILKELERKVACALEERYGVYLRISLKDKAIDVPFHFLVENASKFYLGPTVSIENNLVNWIEKRELYHDSEDPLVPSDL